MPPAGHVFEVPALDHGSSPEALGKFKYLPRSQMCLKITSPESPRRGKKVKRETKSFIGRESYYPNFDDV